MKFMKLGSKPDFFQTEGDNIRYVATELGTDVAINVGDVKFYLHKFPLLSKSARLQKLVSTTNDDNRDEIHIHDIPGGAAAFEICAKFCYGTTVTLNAYNVVATRCAAEYLEMYETVEKGNLVYKVEVFLTSSLFRSWKDSIIVLQTTRSLLPWADEVKVVSHCLDSIASKATIDASKVEWSYSYNHKKLPSENGNDPSWNGVGKQKIVPKDWWVEDLCGLPLDLYKRVIKIIKAKGKLSADVIGGALNAYTVRRLSGISKGVIQEGDVVKNRLLVATIIYLLPTGSVPCSFLLKLLKAAILLECSEMEKCELMTRISQQLEEATVSDLLIRAPAEVEMMYDVDIVHRLVEEFVARDQRAQADGSLECEFQDIKTPQFLSETSKAKVAKLVDGYLAEIGCDPNLPVSKFVSLAELVSSFPRSSHDGVYRAIDMFLKEHPGITKSEKKRVCKLMDCRKLSAEACTHAVQNERLPLRVVVQVLFFEQARASSVGNRTPDLHGSIRALLPGGSHGSSRSTTTNTEDDWDAVPTAEEIKALKGEISTLKLGDKNDGVGSGRHDHGAKTQTEKAAANKMKGMLMSKKIFSKLWSNKEKNGESSSDTSESPSSMASINAEETKSHSRSRRRSLS